MTLRDNMTSYSFESDFALFCLFPLSLSLSFILFALRYQLKFPEILPNAGEEARKPEKSHSSTHTGCTGNRSFCECGAFYWWRIDEKEKETKTAVPDFFQHSNQAFGDSDTKPPSPAILEHSPFPLIFTSPDPS